MRMMVVVAKADSRTRKLLGLGRRAPDLNVVRSPVELLDRKCFLRLAGTENNFAS